MVYTFFRSFMRLMFIMLLGKSLWTFDNQLLFLEGFGDHRNPMDVPLLLVPFWIQVHGLHLGF